MQKSKMSRGPDRDLVPDTQGQGAADLMKNGKSPGAGKYASGGSLENKKERRFKDWKTTDAALPL